MRNINSAIPMPPGPWDVVVVGAGAAGLMTCLDLPSQLSVLLLNRNTSKRSSSRWAQGGIAAVTRPEDSVDSHAKDTILAGSGICDKDAVNMLVKDAPKCVQHLEALGMEFDRDINNLATTLEAAHSYRRVLHVEDRTGRALVDALQEQVERRKNIFHRRGIRVTKLLVENSSCKGVQVLDGHNLHWISARAVVLATGGGGDLFANTTNPSQSSGEGIALAWNAGAIVEDLEFVQFHPTALKLKDAPCFLLSEALRGEGAVIVDSKGDSPVKSLIGQDLAPRDQVSRALVQSMKKQAADYMLLDLKNIKLEKLQIRFPNIIKRCNMFGINPLKDLIPVAPAAHYWMGGVSTNLRAASSILGLYAVGEVACTGVHGANRLASNSLMECLVFARQFASIDLAKERFEIKYSLPVEISLRSSDAYCAESIVNKIEYLRQLCWDVAGVDRSPILMREALLFIQREIQSISEEPLIDLVFNQDYGYIYKFDQNSRKELNLLLDLKHRLVSSSLLLEACLFRNESRGGHFRRDIPNSLPYWECHSRQQIDLGLFTREVNK